MKCALITSNGNIEQWQLLAIKKCVDNGLLEVASVTHVANRNSQNDLLDNISKTELSEKVPVENLFPDAKKGTDFETCEFDFILNFSGIELEKERSKSFPVLEFVFLSDGKISNLYQALLQSGKNIHFALINISQESRKVIYQGRFRIYRQSYKKTFGLIFSEASTWLLYALEKQLLKSFNDEDNLPKNHLSVSFLSSLFFRIGFVKNKISQRIKLLFTKEVWNVGIVEKHISRFDEGDFLSDVKWLPHPVNGIYADPFGHVVNGQLQIYFEALNFKSNHGIIQHTTLTESFNKNSFKTILDRKEHLSYPYSLEIDGKKFIMPECCASGKIVIHELNESGHEILNSTELQNGIEAVDASLIYYRNKWWMFCTLKGDQPDLKLHIYFSDDLKKGFTPHALNPVKTDISSARPGGTMFIKDGILFRPAQDSSYSYGDQICMMQITQLNETEFEEELYKLISPQHLKTYSNGLHTLGSAGNYSLIDAKKIEWKLNTGFFTQLFRK